MIRIEKRVTVGKAVIEVDLEITDDLTQQERMEVIDRVLPEREITLNGDEE